MRSMKSRDVVVADLFCGAGGTSTGVAEACLIMGAKPKLVAVNHWRVAVETHAKNHPWAEHYCTGLDQINPSVVIPGGRLDLLVASPECVHHSNARGGKPMSDQSRASAWLILKWVSDLVVDRIIIENVPEFENWGPLGTDGRPMESKRGWTFNAFIDALRGLNYTVDWKVLNAADYGDATTRRRLFVLAKRNHGNRKFPVTWPDRSHSESAGYQMDLLGGLKPWRSARDIIDWTMPSPSIFDRKRPLAATTLERIYAGAIKFKWPEPFLVILRNHMAGRSIDDPLPTLTAGGQHVGLCQPEEFTVTAGGPEGQGRNPHTVNQPLATILTENRTGLVEPFIVPQFSEHPPRSLERPLGTITTTSRGVGLAEPFMLGQQSNASPRSTSQPVPTVAGAGAISLIEPFVAELRGGQDARSIDKPLSTICTRGAHHGVVEPFVLPFRGERDGQNPRTHSIDAPLPTITTIRAHGVVEPVFFNMQRKQDPEYGVDRPMPTVTATSSDYGMAEPVMFSMEHLRRHKDGDPFVLPTNHGKDHRVCDLDRPMPTITTVDAWALAEPFLASYYGTQNVSEVSAPVPTVTTRDRFAMVTPGRQFDIRFRMLHYKELAAAHSFPADYEFAGTREDKVKQIGNSVCVKLAAALALEQLNG